MCTDKTTQEFQSHTHIDCLDVNFKKQGTSRSPVPRSGAARAVSGRIHSKAGKLATLASGGRSHERSGRRRPSNIGCHVR